MGLPDTPLANEFVRVPGPQEVFPIDLLLCDACGHLQIAAIVDPQRLFGNYVYVTGTSEVTVGHFQHYAAHIVDRFHPATVLEIGSNDGTMLKAFQKLGVTVTGVDPATALAAKAAGQGVRTIPGFFNLEMATRILASLGVADVIVANNVFAHAEDLMDIVEGVSLLLTDSGVFVFEVAYLLDLLEKNMFDIIYHEHYSYHAVAPILHALKRLGLYVFDLERTPEQLGRGSIRIYAAKRPRDATEAVTNALRAELAVNLFEPTTYRAWRSKIAWCATTTRERLDGLIASGATMAGFGAPAKMTTLMYSYGLGSRHCPYVIDDSPWKQGLLTPGLNIPVLPPEALLEKRPDVCVIYAWNFAESILRRFAGSGIKFIVPLPEYREVTP
jgi:SAM-dependent methyltransferase